MRATRRLENARLRLGPKAAKWVPRPYNGQLEGGAARGLPDPSCSRACAKIARGGASGTPASGAERLRECCCRGSRRNSAPGRWTSVWRDANAAESGYRTPAWERWEQRVADPLRWAPDDQSPAETPRPLAEDMVFIWRLANPFLAALPADPMTAPARPFALSAVAPRKRQSGARCSISPLNITSLALDDPMGRPPRVTEVGHGQAG